MQENEITYEEYKEKFCRKPRPFSSETLDKFTYKKLLKTKNKLFNTNKATLRTIVDMYSDRVNKNLTMRIDKEEKKLCTFLAKKNKLSATRFIRYAIIDYVGMVNKNLYNIK